MIFRNSRRLLGIAIVIIFIVAGTYLMLKSRAASSSISYEAEGGTISAGATVGPDTAASGAKYVRFAAATPTPTPTPTPNPTPAGDPVIAAAGDISCDPASGSFNGGNGSSGSCREKYTSDVIVADSTIKAVLLLGDNVYECGGLTAFQNAYGPSWGRFKSITHPSIGNHEYIAGGTVNGVPATGCDSTGKGMGYYNYFGAAAGTPGQGYYSYDVGAWHLVALNTNCSQAGGCGPGSPQYTWLQKDLAAHPAKCTLAYFHHPIYSQDTSGGKANAAGLPLWQVLYAANADVVLNGHSHNYQRFAAMNPNGQVDTAKGIMQIIAGTGGANHTSISTAIMPKPLVADTTTFGVLKMTLHAGSYDWKFVPETGGAGHFTDAGTGTCH